MVQSIHVEGYLRRNSDRLKRVRRRRRNSNRLVFLSMEFSCDHRKNDDEVMFVLMSDIFLKEIFVKNVDDQCYL